MKRAGLRLAAVFAVGLTAVVAGVAPDHLLFLARGAPPPLARPAAFADSLSSGGPSINGIRDPAWSPDGKRLAVSWFETIWTMAPDGRNTKRIVNAPAGWIGERDPAWSPDGKWIAFSADTSGEYDLWIAPARGGAARRLTTMPGDERWPSWTRDGGRVVFSHRDPKQPFQLYVGNADGSAAPVKLTPDASSEWQAQVSPDGKFIAFISDRQAGTDASDVWVREFPAKDAGTGSSTRTFRVTSTAGLESHPVWAPDNARVAYLAVRQGQASGIFVSDVPFTAASAPPILASRHVGYPAWSPDGDTLAIATVPSATPAYNGNPDRNDDDPPAALGDATEYALWRVAAPRPVDHGAASVDLRASSDRRWAATFDQAWQTLKALYYASGPSAAAWDGLRAKYRPLALAAHDATAAEDAIDAMVVEQPLIKPATESPRGVVASGSPLASRAGTLMLEKGGNIVDAGIAVAFALGVVEPDATSIGGDGQAILFLKGMPEPVVVEYKDMTPAAASLSNPKLFNPNGTRTAPDGPTVTNIPGVVAGLNLLYQKYGSRKIAWSDLLQPAITLADEGFVLDEALPTTIAVARSSFAKYPESAKLFLPSGRVPRAGDRFVNKDYADTLKTIAREGADSFYRGSIAARIAADMSANGGVMTAEDLAQYRAVERKPLVGHYRGNAVFSAPPPVPTGAQLIETLNILDNYQPKPAARYTSDADYFHYVIESWRVRDGGGRIGDPDRTPVDLGNHLEAPHALERFRLIDPKHAYVATGGRGGGAGPLNRTRLQDSVEPEEPGEPGEPARTQTGTTAFVVADAEGNMIAFTQTLSTWGGNYYVSKGLGFLYNDHFRGGGRGVQPLTRSSSTSVPTLVFAPSAVDPGRYGIQGYTPRIAVGCAGNNWIPASVYNIITNVIDGGMDAQHAIEAPRFLIGNDQATGRSRVQIEDRIPRSILADLEARGHTFAKVGRKGEVKYGYAAVAVINAAKGTVEAGAEPRRSHGAATPGR